MMSLAVMLFGIILAVTVLSPVSLFPFQSSYYGGQRFAYRPPQFGFGIGGPQYAMSRPMFAYGPQQFAFRPPFFYGPQFGMAPQFAYRPPYFAIAPQFAVGGHQYAMVPPFGYPGPMYPPIYPQPTIPGQCPPQTVACFAAPCTVTTCPKYPTAVCQLADPCQPCGAVVFIQTTNTGQTTVIPQAQCLI